MPAKAHVILLAHKNQPRFTLDFDCRSVADPRTPHGEEIIYLVQYLMRSRDVGIRFSPNPSKGFECYCDANFSGNWNKAGAAHNPSTAKSWSDWIIFYSGCPIIWASKLQSQVALSTTEAEYIALSMQTADTLTKALPQNSFCRHRQAICGQ